MRRWIAAACLAVLPCIAQAATIINPKLIPDGTYTVHVDTVVDAKNIVVTLANGLETALTTDRDSISFDKIAANDTLKVSLSKGIVVTMVKGQ